MKKFVVYDSAVTDQQYTEYQSALALLSRVKRAYHCTAIINHARRRFNAACAVLQDLDEYFTCDYCGSFTHESERIVIELTDETLCTSCGECRLDDLGAP